MRLGIVAVSPPKRVRYRWAKARRGVNPGRGKKGQMARGFWTGLLHGGVVGIAALAALSLAAPVPRPDPAALPEAAALPAEDPAGEAPPAEIEAAETRPAEISPAGISSETPSDAATAPSPADAPRAEAVDLPVGSEFGRGGDVAPRLPAPLATARPDQPEAPAVVAPTSEPAPVAITAADPRPQPAGGQDGPLQGVPAEGEAAPRLDRPAALPRPAAPVMPGRAVADAPDLAPVLRPDRDGPRPAPGLPAPALDLSLPPDLSDLQGLSRD